LRFELSPLFTYKPRVSAVKKSPFNATTRFCAVLGQPIRHSASPAMQNAGIAKLGLNWRYLACEVEPKNLRAAIAGAKSLGFVGLNLTVPHKLIAVKMVDALAPSAKTWGAVNTIQFVTRGGKTLAVGHNTDVDAITTSLQTDLGVTLRGAKVLLLGAGGAGRTAALKLASENVAELFLVNRTASKAQAVAREIRRRFPRVKVAVGYPTGKIDLLLNATSLGLKLTDASPLDEKVFPLAQTRAVYDMIYRPAETKLLKAAKRAGCKTVNGLGMLLHQGAAALAIWSGQPAPVAVMRRALTKEIYGR
jgi:shikimate dehydrogenase